MKWMKVTTGDERARSEMGILLENIEYRVE